MIVKIEVVLLLNFLLLQQAIAGVPNAIKTWVATPLIDDENGVCVTLTGNQRTWTVTNSIITKNGGYTFLCKKREMSKMKKLLTKTPELGEIRFCSKSTYDDSIKLLQYNLNGIVPTVQDHGIIEINGKVIFFLITTLTNLPIQDIQKTMRLPWYEDTIILVFRKYLQKLEQLHFTIKLTFRSLQRSSLCIGFTDTNQLLFRDVGGLNTDVNNGNKLKDVLCLFRAMLIFSIPRNSVPTRDLKIISTYWINLKLDDELKKEFKDKSLRMVPQEFKDLCIFVLDENKRSQWIGNYKILYDFIGNFQKTYISLNNDWSTAAEVSNYLRNLESFTSSHIEKLRGKKSEESNPIWAYINSSHG